MRSHADRTGVLVVRAWIEDGRLKARITRTVDVEQRDSITTAASTAEQIHTEVRHWLDELRQGSSSGGRTVTNP